ncbi:MAG: DUF262 domain-containing protein [Methyloprofundus sp.]|nr:DUF262 domain-containing protein [Methyloprofundus sp.]
MTISKTEENDGSYSSSVCKLGSKTFLQHYFSIPIYQRLYVWGEEQVELLVEDVLNSFSREQDLYLGNILLKKSAKNAFDLIDGQQRFTTLWLLFNFIEAQIHDKTFCLHEAKPRLQFSIRDDVALFLGEIPSRLKEGVFPVAPESSPDMQRMVKALSIIKMKVSEQFNLSNSQDKLIGLHKFLLEQVHLIVTFVPNNTDLNKLFELINGRGVQLQQHEILKAIILEKLPENKRTMYGRVWDVCAEMNNYIHRNLKNALVKTDGVKITSFTWADYFKESPYPHQRDLGDLDKLFLVENGGPHDVEKSLFDILDQNNNLESSLPEQKLEQEKPDYLEENDTVESIISFPTLLLYALVTFDSKFIEREKGNLPEYVDKNLINIFRLYLDRSNQVSFAENFMAHLFKMRVVFDENVIKFVEPNESEERFGLNRLPEIARLEKNKSGKSISARWDKQALDHWSLLTQLQAMLYHAFTRTTQYWLIPYLKNLVERESNNSPLELLMKIDHQLYSSVLDGTVLEKVIAYPIKDKPIPVYQIPQKPKNYHAYGQYWFYKMDWVIYYLSTTKNISFDGGDVSNFVFTARNSVEHIYPQKDGAQEDWLHNFGNLVLISVGMNSAYGAMSLKEKKAKHEAFKQKYLRSETLKLDLFYKLFNNRAELGAGVKEHQDTCLEWLKEYNGLIASYSKGHKN